jgi:Ion channel/Calcium-activated BK potassium channel alpha subunit
MVYNAEQWHFVGAAFRDGFIFWVVMLVYAAAHDLIMSQMLRTESAVMPVTSLSLGRLVYTLHWKRNRLGHKYRDTNYLAVIDAVRCIFNIIACAVYVVGTYRRTVAGPVRAINIVLALAFLVDICAGLTLAESALRHAITLRVVFEALSIPSLLHASGPNAYLHLGCLRSYAAYCNYSSVHKRLGLSYVSSYHFSALLLAKSLTLVFILAAGIQLFEIPGDVLSPAVVAAWAPDNDWHFFNSFYYTIVTLSTVGYGDLTPDTILGRLFSVFMIIVGVIVFSNVIGQIVEHVRYKRGAGSFVKRANSRHVIVAGCPQLADIVRFTSEFYARARLSSANAKVVVLVQNAAWTDEEWSKDVARNQFLQRRVSFYVGSVRNPTDLHRVRIASADALFLIVSPFGGVEPSDVDAATVINALAIRNVRTDIPIYSVVLLKSSLFQVQIAQGTAVNDDDPELLFRKQMRGSAQSAGLRQEIFALDSHSAPRELQPHIICKAIASGVNVPTNDRNRSGCLVQKLHSWATRRSITCSEDVADRDENTEEEHGHAQETFLGLDGGGVRVQADHDDDHEKGEEENVGRKKKLKNLKALQGHPLSFRLSSGRVEDPRRDLERSTSICLQDVHAALIAAHIKANGVGTLITNMTLDIDHQESPDEPAWLREYRLGAVCNLLPLIIPYQLHGVLIADVAVSLFDYGLVLVALSSDPDCSAPDLVLDLNRVLLEGDIGLFLTYHSRRFAYAALLLAGISFGMSQSSESESAEELDQSRQVTDFKKSAEADISMSILKFDGGASKMESLDRANRVDEHAIGKPGEHVARYHNTLVTDSEEMFGTTSRCAVHSFLTRSCHIELAGDVAKAIIRKKLRMDKKRNGQGFRRNSSISNQPELLPRSTKPQCHAFSDDDEDEQDVSDSDSDPKDMERHAAGKPNTGRTSSSEVFLEAGLYDANRSFSCPQCKSRVDSRFGIIPRLGETWHADAYIPRTIQRHIILAGNGDMMLQYLPLLLKYIWRRNSHEKRRSYFYRGRVPVVVILPWISDRLRAKFSKYEGSFLFFVEGPSNARKTWKRASLTTAKGVVVLADYTETWETADARTIFATTTLDAFIKDSQDVFVVSELVEEKSLQFLREPVRRRRIDAGNATAYEEKTHALEPAASSSNLAESGVGGGTARIEPGLLPRDSVVAGGSHMTSPGSDKFGGRQHEATRNGFADSAAQAADCPRSAVGAMGESFRMQSNGNPPTTSEVGSVLSPPPPEVRDDAYVAQSSSSPHSGLRQGSGEETKISDSLIQKTFFSEGDNDIGDDNRPVVSRALRGTLFSRSSYASGDLLLHSAALSILIREYVEPGFAHVYKELVGAGCKRLGALKIRLVRMSRAVLDNGSSTTTLEGGRALEYREIVVHLIRLGATPLGVYRSGGAPVRIPVRSRLRRGAEYEQECVRLVKDQRIISTAPGAPRPEAANTNTLLESFGKLKEKVRGICSQKPVEQSPMHDANSAGAFLPSDVDTEIALARLDDGTDFAQLEDVHRDLTSARDNGGLVDSDSNVQENLHVCCGQGDVRSGGQVTDSGIESSIKGKSCGRCDLESAHLSPVSKSRSQEQGEYEEFRESGNRLPYVLTVPEPYSLVSERDGVYILCDPEFELPSGWCEGYAQGLRHSESGMWS